MKHITRFSTLLLILQISISATNAQIHNPVKWRTSIKNDSKNTYTITYSATIEPGWHIYGLNIEEGGPIPTSFNYDNQSELELIGAPKPTSEPDRKFDETFSMDVELFDNQVSFNQKVKINSNIDSIIGYITYMSCNESTCLPPQDIYFSFPVKYKQALVNLSDNTADYNGLATDSQFNKLDSSQLIIESNSQSITDIETINTLSSIKDKTPAQEETPMWLLFLQALLGGLAAIITPCVYPVIPLTVSFFSRNSTSRARTVSNALAFGISITAIYTSVGLISGLFQIDLMNEITSNWIPNLIFFLLFITFAASFFGAFEIMLPNKWANKIDQQADKGGFLGAFFMALATAVVSFSCTGPIAGVVLGNAMRGDVITPVIGMLGFGIGFAFPFTIIALFPQIQSKLPKSGGWLNSVKVVFAFLMLLFSLIFLGLLGHGAISRDFILAIAIAILILLGLYLIGKIKFSHDSDLPFISVPRILLAIISWAFAIYLFTGIFGAPLKKLSPFLPAQYTLGLDLSRISSNTSNNTTIGDLCIENPKYADDLHMPYGLKGYFDWDEALDCAREQNKPVLVDFVGHSCKNCKKMYAEVWSDERVQQKLSEDFILVALYTDDNTKLPEDEWITSKLDGRVKKTLGKKNLDFQVTKFNSNALPMYVIVNADGEILTNSVKYYTYSSNVDAFISFLDEGLENYN